MYIVDNCDGPDAGITNTSKGLPVNLNQSQVWASNTFVRLDANSKLVSKPKPSDDKIILGYTYDGLPFQMVVDGFYGCSRENVFKFIDEEIAPLIDNYAQQLSMPGNHPEKLTEKLIDTVRNLKNAHAHQGIDFTMSLAVTYENQGQLKCAGFGVGDIGIALRRTDGTVEQLVTNNKVNKFKDGFDDASANMPLDSMIAKNKLFNVDVKPGDEMVAYTWMHDELQETAEMFELNRDDPIKKETVDKKRLIISKLEDKSLFDFLLSEKDHWYQKKLADAKANSQWGDDTTIGQIFIPDQKLRAKLQSAHLNDLQKLIDKVQPNKVKMKAQNLYDAANALIQNKEDIPAVHHILALTKRLLVSSPEARPALLREFNLAAAQAQGSASKNWQNLGKAMIAFGLAMLTVGFIFSNPVTAIAAIGIAISGQRFFAHGRQKGLSKEMSELADEITKPDSEPKPPPDLRKP